MALPVPNLDDLDFERLVEDARAQIPRYAPEWTDHNLHDPGITFLELLAWIVDQQLYQVGFVGDRHLESFAALLGVRKQAAAPARGLIWPENPVVGETDLERGRRVTCVQQPDMPFELAANIHLTPAQRIRDGFRAVTASGSINLARFNQQPRASFAFRPEASAQGWLEISFDRPLVRDEAINSPYPVALGIEVDPHPAARADKPTPWGPLLFEYRTDHSSWRPVEIVEDGTFALARTGIVLLRLPASPQAMSSILRLRLDRGFYPIPPRIVRIQLNVLPIVQLETRAERVLVESQDSHGLPDQTCELETSGLPDARHTHRPLCIEVAEQGEFKPWEQTKDLSECGPEDRVYRLDADAGQVVFGNGLNGRIPKEGARIRHLDYHLTRGAEGNLTAGLSWRVGGGGDIFGANPAPLNGGEDAWDMGHLLRAARQRVLERRVCLTNADLERASHALQGFGVARVDVLACHDPAFPKAAVPGARTLVVTPWHDPSSRRAGAVAERYLEEVKAALGSRRVLGERLHVIGHGRVPIRVQAELLIDAGTDAVAVQREAISRLNARLTDIAVRDDVKPWPSGRPVTVCELKTILAGVPDVIAVPRCRVAGKDGAFAENDIALKRHEVAVGEDHDIRIAIARET